MVGCLKLQCTLWGIKRHQGSHQQKRQPITSDLLQRFRCSLEPSNYDHTMVQAACCLGFFSFLGAGKFTLNPDIHLTIDNIQADSLLNPPNFRIFIKCSKTNPFHQGCCVDNGTSSSHLCPVPVLIQYLYPRRLYSWPPVSSPRWYAFNPAVAVFHHAVHAGLSWSPWLFYWP